MTEIYPIILKSESMEVRLEGHDLPTPPLTFTSSLKLKKNEYPGNPDPTVQILGESFKEIEFSGKFKDYAYRSNGYANSMIDKLMGLKSLGETTVMQYANQIFVGVIEEVTSSTYNVHEIEYRIKFNVFALNLNKTPKVISHSNPDTRSVTKTADKLKTMVSEMKNISEKVILIHNQMNVKVAQIKEDYGLNDFNQLVSVGKLILSDIKSIKSELKTVDDNIFTDSINRINFEQNIRTLGQQTYKMVEIAQSRISPVKNTIIYIVAEEDTLYSISNKFYGDANKWTLIAIENKLENVNLIRGQKLVIPL